MSRKIIAGAAALMLLASAIAYAQQPPNRPDGGRPDDGRRFPFSAQERGERGYGAQERGERGYGAQERERGFRAEERGRPDGGPRFAFSPEDRAAFLDARVAALHAGLKLTPDQEKSWPAFEQAYRDLAAVRAKRMNEVRAETPPDPVQRAQRAADALLERGTALKHYADAAAPLYQGLDDGQKRRFTMLSRMGRPHFGQFASARSESFRSGPDRPGFGRPGFGRPGFGRSDYGRSDYGRSDFGPSDRDGYRPFR